MIVYRSRFSIDRLDARHPGLRAMVEELARRSVPRDEIARQVKKRFRVNININSIRRYWESKIRPQEVAEAAAYREAKAQARALLEEMKADPSLDAAQIAELMLANQIVRDRTKLAEADIMDLYKEQRERQKLELQSKALRLRERQTVAVLAKLKKPKKRELSGPELAEKIREIYGLNNPPQPAS